MKKLILFFNLILLEQAFSNDAVVIVLEAPLLKEPKLNSTVLQTLRKGQRVYVPTDIARLSETTSALPDFIQTYDRVGNIAYIPTKYIKIITNDLSENNMPISIGKHDPTDYRLEEPIPSTYPFADVGFLRVNISVSMGNNIKAPFDYNSQYTRQTFSSETGVRLNISHRIQFDNYDRYYFGLLGAVTTNNNKIYFQNSNSASENRSVLRLGPIITYDAFKNSNYRLTLGTGFTYNYHKSSLKMSDSAGQSEERLFSGYSLSPFANTYLQVVDVLPATDFIGGADLNLYLPHRQKSKDDITIPTLWESSSSEINVNLKPQVSFFLGVQVKY